MSLAKVRRVLAREGLLLAHDRTLPAITRIVAGEVVSGSWWGHPKGKAIYNVLVALEDETASVKLVGGKVTIVHPTLFPALASAGRSASHDALSKAAREILAEVEARGSLRTDDLTKERRKAVAVLEKRLLVMSEQVHTEGGKHARVLSSWDAWRKGRGLRVRDLPSPPKARAALRAPVSRWVGPERAARLLPFGGA